MATLLMMDDLDALREMYADLFRSLDYTVLDFNDAGPALETVDFPAVDLVITDLDMPTDGRTAIREIRARGFTMPIVVMSGSFQESGRQALYNLGAQEVLQKPVRVPHLLKVVVELLGRQVLSCADETCCG